jgi:hypothetical protein
LESGDNPYPFKKIPNDDSEYGEQLHPHTSTYRFKVDGTKYFASIDHSDDKQAEVVFGSHSFEKYEDLFSSPYKMRGDKGSKSTRVMSTIHHIIKKHVADHPDLSTIMFTSDISEPSRVSLYTRYAKKMGGVTLKANEVDPYKGLDPDARHHIIPADSYRK